MHGADGNGIEITFDTPSRGTLGDPDKGETYAVTSEGKPHSGRDPIDLDGLLAFATTHRIDLTVVAPQSLQAPVTAAHAIPEQWTAETAAQVLVSSLPERESELVMEVWSLSSLWPLPR